MEKRVSPLRRQSAPPSVEMTILLGCGSWDEVRVEKRVSPLRRQSAPPSVEMTFCGVRELMF